jgi:hypothetical protein
LGTDAAHTSAARHAHALPGAAAVGVGDRTLGAMARGGTDGFAIAALVLGLLGSSVLALIFGLVALSRIKKSGKAGRGMAVAGVALGGAWLAAAAIVVPLALHNAGHTRGTISTMPHSVGQCFDLADDAHPSKATFHPCAGPHQWEVYAVHELPPGTYPGRVPLMTEGSQLCGGSITAYFAADVDLDTIEVNNFVPTRGGWAVGNRSIVCIADNLDHTPRTGSLADSHG